MSGDVMIICTSNLLKVIIMNGSDEELQSVADGTGTLRMKLS